MSSLRVGNGTHLEIVQRIQRVDARYAANVQPQQHVPVVLSGILDSLSAQEKVRFEGPEHPGSGRRQHRHADGASFLHARRHRQVFDVGLFHVYLEITEKPLASEVPGPKCKKKTKIVFTRIVHKAMHSNLVVKNHDF